MDLACRASPSASGRGRSKCSTTGSLIARHGDRPIMSMATRPGIDETLDVPRRDRADGMATKHRNQVNVHHGGVSCDRTGTLRRVAMEPLFSDLGEPRISGPDIEPRTSVAVGALACFVGLCFPFGPKRTVVDPAGRVPEADVVTGVSRCRRASDDAHQLGPLEKPAAFFGGVALGTATEDIPARHSTSS